MKRKSIIKTAVALFTITLALTGCTNNTPKKTLDSISVDSSAAKVDFLKGEAFTYDGLVVAARYSDNSIAAVTNFTVDSSEYKSDTLGNYTIKVSYTEESVTKDDSYIVTVGENGTYTSLSKYRSYLIYDLKNEYRALESQLSGTLATEVKDLYEEGCANINLATNIEGAAEAFVEAFESIANAIPLASGIYAFDTNNNTTYVEALGQLEAYTVRRNLTGITLFENGGYVMYNPRVSLGSENYITGYGFGTLAEGSLTAPLDTEKKEEWKMYWHTATASDPGTLCYHNSKDSDVGDFYGYMGAGFWTTFMNAEKNGYVWTPELADQAEPTPVNSADGGATATQWKWKIKTDIKYSTNSTVTSRAAFNDRTVAAEDYITAFKLLLNQANGLSRGSELANSTSGAILGAKNFYNSTETAEKGIPDADIPGLFIDDDGYFNVIWTAPLSAFYTKYYISSSLYMPVPKDFIDLVGVENFLNYSKTKDTTPFDNGLSLGAYVGEYWSTDAEVVFKKNPNYVYATTKYAIEGVHIDIVPGMSSDPELGFNEFIAGKKDSTGIPTTKLKDYKNDPRTKTTTGDANFKLNVNACDQETWEGFFGKYGTVDPNPDPSTYWQCEPALSNRHFSQGLSYALNRVEFADSKGVIASTDFFAPNYMSDPVNGKYYNETNQHKNAVAMLKEGTDGYGYNLEMARDYFRIALEELEAEGLYEPGTPENPTVIELEIAWMYPSDEQDYHIDIKNYFESAFNHESVSGGKYKLKIDFWVGDVWSDVYYNKLLVGQYDIGFGSISGNSLNPLDFMSVLSSDPSISQNFTLNWGPDTNDPEDDILVFNGERFSYDALYKASNGAAIINEGAQTSEIKEVKIGMSFEDMIVADSNWFEYTLNDDGSATICITVALTLPEDTALDIWAVAVCWYQEYYYGSGKYYEVGLYTVSSDAGYITVGTYNDLDTVTIHMSKELVDSFTGWIGFDLYYDLYTKDGELLSENNYYSIYYVTPATESGETGN